MPPSKRARKTAVASASTAGEASLLDLPTGWEKALSLPSLKQVAARSGLERGWQAVGKEHRAELVAALAQRAAEWRSFVASVLPLEVALQKATPQNIRRSTKPVDVARCAAIDAAVRAAVHLVPSGSGVHIGGGLVLTCAHCVDHDDDEDDDEDRDEGEPQKRDFAGGSSRPLTRTERVAYEAAVVAWRLAAPTGPERVGRLKMCVTASGVHRVGACVHVDEANDLALLRLEGAAPPAGLGALALGAEGDDAPGTAVLAVGNPCAGGSKRGTCDPSSAPRGALPRPSRAPPRPCPAPLPPSRVLAGPWPGRLLPEACAAPGTRGPPRAPLLVWTRRYDWDLELASGATPRKNGFTPFWTSAGALQGELAPELALAKGVGPQRHSCWTYWGHSGCPIVRAADGQARIVALHNSWDDSNGQRHGVPLRALREFVASAGVGGAATGRASGDDISGGSGDDTEEMAPLAKRLAARR